MFLSFFILMIFVALLLIGIFLLYTTHYYFLVADVNGLLPAKEPRIKQPIQGPICGFLDIPLPTVGLGKQPYWCFDA